MLRVDNTTETELGTVEGKRNPPKFGETPQAIRLTEEELNVYKKCSNESFLKAGVPFAIFCDVARAFLNKKKGDVGPIEANPPLPKPLNLKRGLMFFGNIIFGSFLYTPVCYQRLKDFHNAVEKRKMLEDIKTPVVIEGSSPKTQPEDFSYPTDHMINIGESESSFSADFNSTKFIMEDDVKPVIPRTTYDDLRSRNRERQVQGPLKSPPPTESSQRLSTPSEPILSDPPPRRVKRNKYGDEME